jgi:Nif-specific ferredoxin III
MEKITAVAQSFTRDGSPWRPSYLLTIDAKACIGCGRCFKVCGQSVMSLQGVTEDGDLVPLDSDDEIERKVMAIVNHGACVGCASCSRTCYKNCHTHGSS